MRAKIVYSDTPMVTGLTFSVHRPSAWPEEKGHFFGAMRYDPPWPIRVVGKGFALLKIEDRKDVYWFTSLAEIDHFCAIMGERLLPSVRELARREGTSRVNGHWLSRIPKRSFKERARLVAFIRKSDGAFRALGAKAPTPRLAEPVLRAFGPDRR